ncbi:MAG: phosphoglucomutase [Methanobacteriota archaeon]|nr:MAG: phosphoglucomutase [Euryarchaeota archaeon]
MAKWAEHCFKAYDIRGLANGDGSGELTPAFAERLGRALGTYLGAKRLAVGRDIRTSSPALADALMQGMQAAGTDVIDLEICTTGALYHACWTMDVDGGVMVTASHLPMPTHNGFKMCRGNLPLAGEEIQELRQVFMTGDFPPVKEHGFPRPTCHLPRGHRRKRGPAWPPRSRCRGRWKRGAWPLPRRGPRGHRGEVEAVHCTWDASEPNHGADPTRPYNMTDLADLVAAHGCEFGLGSDGDGDRVGAVTETGAFVYPDRLVALLVGDVLADLNEEASANERTVIYDVKCSMNVESAILAAGGTPLMARTGHSFMKRALAERPGCRFAAEMSGHLFPADRGWYGFDCSLYNAARLVELWSRQAPDGPTFGEALDAVAPNLPTTGECKVPCEEDRKEAVVAGITSAFADLPHSTVDGVRVRFEDEDGNLQGWYLARRSNTEAVLVMRAEARTEQGLERIRAHIEERVADLIDVEGFLDAFA